MQKFRDLSLRSMFIGLAVVTGVAFLVTTLVARSTESTMTSLAAQTETVQATAAQAEHAYEQWLWDDDQANMYGAVVALRDASQHDLAETTWGQSVDGYNGALAAVSKLKTLVTLPSERALVAKIDSDLASYNSFALQLRDYAVKGEVQKAVHVVTVDNLQPSNDLPVQFEALRKLEVERVAKLTSDLKNTASSGSTSVLVVAIFAFALIAGAIFFTARSILRPIANLEARLTDIADGDGDLTQRLPENGAAELSRVSKAFNRFVAKIDSTVSAISRRATSIGTAAAQLSNVSTKLSDAANGTTTQAETAASGASQVSGGLEMVAASTEELEASVIEISGETHAAATDAGLVVGHVREANELVVDLGERSAAIGAVVNLINSIAEQTNLLALNATIEAARAGDAGKGFAVVAEEVKQLAQQTARSTDEIRNTVQAIQVETARVVSTIGEATEAVENIAARQSAIAGAIEEQSATTKEMARTISDSARGAQTIAAAISDVAGLSSTSHHDADEVRHAAADLNDVASELLELTNGFRTTEV